MSTPINPRHASEDNMALARIMANKCSPILGGQHKPFMAYLADATQALQALVQIGSILHEDGGDDNGEKGWNYDTLDAIIEVVGQTGLLADLGWIPAAERG